MQANSFGVLLEQGTEDKYFRALQRKFFVLFFSKQAAKTVPPCGRAS